MATINLGQVLSPGLPDSRGEQVHFRFFESFVLLTAISLSWLWAFKASYLTQLTSPLGLARHLDLSFLLFPGGPYILAATFSLCCLSGFVRRAPAFSYGLAFLIMHILYVLRFSLGKVGHGSNFIGMTLLGFFLAMLFYHTEYDRRRFALGFTYGFIGLAYVLSACSKLIGTGILWADGHHLWMWIAERSIDLRSQTGIFEPNPVQSFVMNHEWAATGMLAIGLATEALGWLFWWPRTRPWFTIAAVCMHLGISFILQIHFLLYVVELLLVGLPWPLYLNRFIFNTSKPEYRRLHLHSATHPE